MDYWINGTHGRKISFNGCNHHDDCFSCPLQDCIAAVKYLKEDKHERKAPNKDKTITDFDRHEYYIANRERILERQRERRLERKRQAERDEQQGIIQVDLRQHFA